MPAEFQYAVLRLVPSVERGERVNVGVVLFCRTRDFLALRVELDRERIATLAPALELDTLTAQLEALRRVAAGDPGAGPVARLPASERFGWLTAPSSTILQPSEVHTGLCEDPEADLERLTRRLVG